MATKYETFNEKLSLFHPYFEALSEVKKGRLNEKTRGLTSLLVPEQDMKLFLLEGNSRPNDFKAPLLEKEKIEREKFNAYISDNPIESILGEASESEIDPLVKVVMPVECTVGIKKDKELYNEITGLRMTVDDMERVIKTRDSKKMKSYTGRFYESVLNNPDITDEEKRITNAVITASPNFVPEFYSKRAEMTSEYLNTKLDGKKSKYLAAILKSRKDKDLVGFMLDVMSSEKKQAERDNTYI